MPLWQEFLLNLVFLPYRGATLVGFLAGGVVRWVNRNHRYRWTTAIIWTTCSVVLFFFVVVPFANDKLHTWKLRLQVEDTLSNFEKVSAAVVPGEGKVFSYEFFLRGESYTVALLDQGRRGKVFVGFGLDYPEYGEWFREQSNEVQNICGMEWSSDLLRSGIFYESAFHKGNKLTLYKEMMADDFTKTDLARDISQIQSYSLLVRTIMVDQMRREWP